MGKDFLTDEEMAALDSGGADFISDDDMAKLEAKPEPSFGRQAFDAVMKGVDVLESYTGAPVRAGLKAAIDMDPETTILGQFANQFGEDTAKAPTGKDLAAMLGASRKEDIPVFPRALVPKRVEDFFNMPEGEKYVKASPAGIAGLGVEMATDPLSYVSFGAPAAGKTVARNVGKAVEKGADAAADIGKVARGAKQGFATAAKETKPVVEGMLGNVEKLWAGTKGAITEGKGTAEAAKEISTLGQKARQTLIRRLDEIPPEMRITAIGNGKEILDLDDETAILRALMEPGENEIKQFVATKAATQFPGQINADEYLKVLNMPIEERLAAKEFLPYESAKEMVPAFEETKDLFKGATSKRWDELQGIASSKYDPAHTKKVVDEITMAWHEADRLKGIPATVKTELEAVDDIIMNGIGARKHGLKEIPLNQADAAEQFNRLQAARQLIDTKLNWAKREGISQAEDILRSTRAKIDEVLKFTPEKVEVDDLYRNAKGLEKKFFGALEFNKNGEIDIDAAKIARMIGDTDQAKRFKESLQEFKAFAARPDIDPEFAAKANDTIAKLEASIETMDKRRALQAFRMRQGPTSPAIERTQAVLGKESPLASAYSGSAGFVNQAEQVTKEVSQKLGKPIADFSDTERSRLTQYWVWKNKNPRATMKQTEMQFEASFPEYKAAKARNAFTDQ